MRSIASEGGNLLFRQVDMVMSAVIGFAFHRARCIIWESFLWQLLHAQSAQDRETGELLTGARGMLKLVADMVDNLKKLAVDPTPLISKEFRLLPDRQDLEPGIGPPAAHGHG